MIEHSRSHTRRLDLESTRDVGPQDDEARCLKLAVRRCVRHASRRRSPRNAFERYVSDSLNGGTAGRRPAELTLQVSQLTEELCGRYRNGLRQRADRDASRD